MKTLSRLMIVATVSLLPLSALAADAKPADMESHGNYDNYWKKADANSDGKLSKDEYQAQSAARFKEMDSNGDGFVSREEMKAYHEKMREKIRERVKARQAGQKQ